MLNLVKEFHDAFGVATPEKPCLPYSRAFQGQLSVMASRMDILAKDCHGIAKEYGGQAGLFLRLQLIQEELGELADAMSKNDLVSTLDALVDLQYVLSGTVLSLGFADAFDEAFREVHRSNMSKLEDGKPVKDEAGRVKKGRDFKLPNLEQFLK